MSKIGKGLLVLVVLLLLVGAGIRFLLFEPGYYQWIPFAVALIIFLIHGFVERRLYMDFLSMKTTKHGLNMGTMVLLVLVLLIAVNYIAVKHNKKWDLTSEKLNSLSDQTTKLLTNLNDTLEVRAFFRGDSPEEDRQTQMVKHYIGLMKDVSSKIDFQVVDPLKRPDLVKQYEVVASGTVVFKYKGKTSSLQDSTGNISEESIANTLLKITREKNKQLYYLIGHGELSFDDEKATGGNLFKKSLADASYDVAPLNLIEAKVVPANADLVMILGPRQALLEPELIALENYAKTGGHLLVSLDPGVKSNIGKWLQKFGVVATDKYIIDQVGQQIAQSAALAVGMEYSPTSEITKGITEKRISLFNLAEPLERDPRAPADWKVEEIVKSSPASFVKNQLSSQLRFDEKTDKKGAATIGMSVIGHMSSIVEKALEQTKDKADSAASANKEFTLVAFGDTDFVSNQLFYEQINRDLIMNSVAFLAKDTELISIRPKAPIGNRLDMTNTQAQLLILGVYLPVPFLLLVMGIVVWFKRRGA